MQHNICTSSAACNYCICILAAGNGTYTDSYVNGTLNAANSSGSAGEAPTLDQLWVWVDRGHSGGLTVPLPPLQGGAVPLPTPAPPARELTLALYVDHSVSKE